MSTSPRRRPRRVSFSAQFALILLLLGLIMGIGSAVVPFYQAQRDRQTLGLQSASRAVAVASAYTDGVTTVAVQDYACRLSALPATAAALNAGGSALAPLLRSAAAVLPAGDVLVALDPTGTPLAVEPVGTTLPLTALLGSRPARSCSGPALRGFFARVGSTTLVAAGAALVRKGGRTLGTVALLRPLGPPLLADVTRLLTPAGGGAAALLVVGDRVAVGTTLAGHAEPVGALIPADWRQALRRGVSPVQTRLGGASVVLAWSVLPLASGGSGAQLLILQPAAPPGTSVVDLVGPLALAALAVLAAGMLLLFLVVQHYVAGPLHRLDQAVVQLPDSGYAVPIPVEGAEEISRLAENLDIMRRRLHRQLVAATGRSTIAAALNSAQPLDQALIAVLKTLVRLEQAGLALLITLHDGDGGGSVIGVGHRGLLPSWPVLESGPGLLGGLVRNPGAVVRDRLHERDLGPVEEALGLHDCLVAPLRLGETPRGLLVIGNKGQAYTAEDRTLCESIADQIMVAIEKDTLLAVSQREANTDAMTGLYNYRFLLGYLEQQVHIAERLGNPLAVLMLDLDRFKALNDEYGHQAGDAALRAFGRRLAETVRRSDLAARYGGEEFTVVMSNTDRSEAEMVAEKIRRAVAGMAIPIGGQDLHITVSIGGVVFPAGSGGDRNLIPLADAALYQAKHHGRDRVEFVDSAQPTDLSPGAPPATPPATPPVEPISSRAGTRP